MKIGKVIQWDMGHRVLNHRSVCKGLHGHRYKAEICVEGDLVEKKDASEEGMVIDFADIKKTAQQFVNKIHAIIPLFIKTLDESEMMFNWAIHF